MPILVDGTVAFARVFSPLKAARAFCRIRKTIRVDGLSPGVHVIAVRAYEGLEEGLTGVHIARP